MDDIDDDLTDLVAAWRYHSSSSSSREPEVELKAPKSSVNQKSVSPSGGEGQGHEAPCKMTSSPTVKEPEVDAEQGHASPSSPSNNNNNNDPGPAASPDSADNQPTAYVRSPQTVELTVRVNNETEVSMDDDVNEYSKLHSVQDHSRIRFPSEPWKVLFAFLWSCSCLTVTGFVTTIAHDRYPVNASALPDLLLDNLPRHAWAFQASEWCFMGLFFIWFFTVFFHHHKWVLLRRQFFITGILYLFRSLSMIVTSLPVADSHYQCANKTTGTVEAVVVRSVRFILGMGLSTAGVLHTCGDWVYSGHTAMLVLAYLLINEYFPKRLWPFKWFCRLVSLFGIFLVLLAKDHYTLDCLAAYYVTTRVFWTYHAIAVSGKKPEENQSWLQAICSSDFSPSPPRGAAQPRIPTATRCDPENPNNRVLWFWPVAWLESGCEGVVPKQYRWPLPFPKNWTRWEKVFD